MTPGFMRGPSGGRLTVIAAIRYEKGREGDEQGRNLGDVGIQPLQMGCDGDEEGVTVDDLDWRTDRLVVVAPAESGKASLAAKRIRACAF
jgi:hypothetical protein